jgi:hypothetical protein
MRGIVGTYLRNQFSEKKTSLITPDLDDIGVIYDDIRIPEYSSIIDKAV